MATFSVSGLGELELGFKEIAEIPENVVGEMLTQGGDVVQEAQKRVGRTYGVYRKKGKRAGGTTISSIKAGKPQKKQGQIVVMVSPKGKNADGNRNAEVAFLNEYGVPSKKISPRPFIRDANEMSADETTNAEAKVYYDWLESRGF